MSVILLRRHVSFYPNGRKEGIWRRFLDMKDTDTSISQIYGIASNLRQGETVQAG